MSETPATGTSEPETPLEPEESPPVEPEVGEPPTGPDEPEQGADEPEQGAEEPPGGAPAMPSDREMAQALGRLEREGERHRKRVVEIIGEEDALELVPCPLCAPLLGLRWPVPPEGEQKDATLRALGMLADEEYLPADNARKCEKCDGLGRRLSGSQVPEHRVILCPDCGGAGYVAVTGPAGGNGAAAAGGEWAPAVTGSVPVPPPSALPPPEAPPEPKPEQDPWGRTPDHPDYGRLPNYVRT